MTRKEASFYLTNMDRKYMEEGMSEALDMAIKALEQEPCDDCISRKEAIKACLDGWNKGYKEILEDIRNLPSVSPFPCDWIPVSERLPEKRGDYLVTQKAVFTDYVYRNIAVFTDKKRPGWYKYDSEWGYYEIDGVVAWMPLPEPYKAESEVEE